MTLASAATRVDAPGRPLRGPVRCRTGRRQQATSQDPARRAPRGRRSPAPARRPARGAAGRQRAPHRAGPGTPSARCSASASRRSHKKHARAATTEGTDDVRTLHRLGARAVVVGAQQRGPCDWATAGSGPSTCCSPWSRSGDASATRPAARATLGLSHDRVRAEVLTRPLGRRHVDDGSAPARPRHRPGRRPARGSRSGSARGALDRPAATAPARSGCAAGVAGASPARRCRAAAGLRGHSPVTRGAEEGAGARPCARRSVLRVSARSALEHLRAGPDARRRGWPRPWSPGWAARRSRSPGSARRSWAGPR